MCDVNSVDIPACVDVYVCISGGMCGHVTCICWCFVYVHMWESVCLWPYDDMYEYAYMWAVCITGLWHAYMHVEYVFVEYLHAAWHMA